MSLLAGLQEVRQGEILFDGKPLRLFAQFDNFRAVFVGFFLIHAVDFRQLRQILRLSGGNGYILLSQAGENAVLVLMAKESGWYV